MKLKRFWSLLMVTVLMVAALSGCAGTEEENVSDPEPEATEVVEANEAVVETEESNEVLDNREPIEPEALGSGRVKWSEEETADGFMKVTNESGKPFTYSKDSGVSLIQVEGYAFKDLNGNNLLDSYEDWRLDVDVRARNLAGLLTVEDIAGLMLFSSHQSEISEELTEGQIAFLEAGGRAMLNAGPEASTEDTVKWNNALQSYAEGTSFGIPVNTSSDPRDAGVSGVPSNLALAATFDPELIEAMGNLTSVEYRLLGISTLLGPQIDVTSEPRWNRTDGTFGEDPALARDLTAAFVDGVQSTFDENGKDLGWGNYSMNAMIKHWPGDGAGEGGREGHFFGGDSQVYPGGQFETQLIPFVDGGFDLEGKTDEATAVMASYSVAHGEAFEEMVGSAFSEYKINNLLREQHGFDGVVCTDWGVIDDFEGFMQGKAYGVFDLPKEERVLRAILAGTDQFGGNDDRDIVVEAYNLGVEELGEETMRERFETSAYRLLKNVFKAGLFENAYVNMEEATEKVLSETFQAQAYDAQLKSVVMLKNTNEAITSKVDEEKPTVYVPMIYVPHSVSFFGVETKAEWKLPVEEELLEKYFNVITDTPATTLTGTADEEGNPTVAVEDIVRASSSELSNAEFALAIIKDPINEGNYFDGFGYNHENAEYIPISLQYGPYTADSEFVRKESISGDITIEEKQSGYVVEKVEVKENRSYFGKDSVVKNYEDVNTVKYAKENMPEEAPVIVAVKSDGAMIFEEIEPYADAIITTFGMSTGSGYGIEDEVLVEVAAGKSEPTGLLPIQMPANMETVEAQLEDVPRDMECYVDADGNTYDFAFGMNWSGVISDERTEKYNVEPLVSPQN